MVDTLCQSKLVHASLQPTLQEVLYLECKHVIQLHARLVQHTDTNKTANECISFEETLRVFFIESQKLTRQCQRWPM